MNSVKANFLNAYFMTALRVFQDRLLQKPIPLTEIEGKVCHFSRDEFETNYLEFLAELDEVMKEVKDIHISYDYASGCLNDITSWKGFPDNQNKEIFSTGSDVSLLINLKRDIESFARKITEFVRRDKNGDYHEEFYAFYFKALIVFGTEEVIRETKEKMMRIENDPSARVFNQYKFDLAELKRKCDQLPNTVSKLNYMQDRLYDFKFLRTQSEQSKYIKDRIIYAPDFESLCLLEIERFSKRLELEIKVLAVQKTETIESKPASTVDYTWNANVTDLLELVVALHQENIIQRKDKKKPTRIELTELFSRMFDVQIKDEEGKLNRASTRYTKTPFLDRLKKAFENYGVEKEEKQLRRR